MELAVLLVSTPLPTVHGQLGPLNRICAEAGSKLLPLMVRLNWGARQSCEGSGGL
jgi:hypothetical protein